MTGDDDALLPPDVRLALAYAPVRARLALATLFALDARLATVRLRARDPALAMLRLAWWRDALAALDDGPPPDEPLLRRIAAALLPRASGGELATIAGGWMSLLDGTPDALASYASRRGGRIFTLGTRLLGADGLPDAGRAGEVWALVDLVDRPDATAAIAMARDRVGVGRGARWPVAARPLGMLATLAVADARGVRSSPSGRLFRMLAHRLTGRTGLGVMPGAA